MRGEFWLPGYDIGPLVSAGATSEVWRARAHDTGDEVALKRLRLRDVAALEELRAVVALIEELGHPHVVPVHRLLSFGDQAVLVLPVAESGTLDDLLRARGGLDPGEVVTTVAPIAEALAAAHERGLVHGDVTPEAILYSADGRPMLADLGIARLVEGGVATAGYADPGRRLGASPTPADDVYALAAVCHAALTGGPPRPGEARPELSSLISDLPPGLVHAIGAALQTVPHHRPTAAQFAELVHGACPAVPVRFPVGLVLGDADLARLLAGRGTEASPPPPSAPPAQSSAPVPPPAVPAGPGGTAGSGGATVPPLDLDTLTDHAGPRRHLALVASGIGVALVAAAIVGGVLWAERTPPAAPAAADDAMHLSERAPSAPGSSARPGTPSSPATPTPTRQATPPEPISAWPTLDATAPGPSPGPTEQAPALTGEAARWAEVLVGLDVRRARAFAESDVTLLDQVYVAGSDLAAADRSEIDKCVRIGCRIEGLRFDIKALTVVSRTSDEVVLEVVDQLQAYTVVGPTGTPTTRPPGPVRRRRITLVPTAHASAGRWVIDRIVPAGEAR